MSVSQPDLTEQKILEMEDPATRGNVPTFLRLWSVRELVFTLVKRDLKVRYKSSAFGFLWSFGKPLLLMVVIAGVFGSLVRIPSGHDLLPYPLHLLASLLPWFFFAGTLQESLFSIIGNQNVIKKVWLPTEVFPASTVFGQLIHFFLAMVVLVPIILFFSVYSTYPDGFPEAGQSLGFILFPGWEIVLLPFIIILQTLLVFAIALILSSLNVFFRDISSLAEIFLTAWFYLTPIIYPANFAREQLEGKGLAILYWIYLLNPVTPITIAYRRILFGKLFRHAPEVSDQTLLIGLGAATVSTMVLLYIGLKVFRRNSNRFADEL